MRDKEAGRLLVATHNPGKKREFAQMLEPLGYKVLSLADYPEISEIEETGTTFAENAEIKARAAARLLGMPVIADDSGLAVAKLDGAPGVYSARYAGEPADDAANIRKLLSELERVGAQASPAGEVTLHSGEKRLLLSEAMFISVIVMYDPAADTAGGTGLVAAEGRLPGWIVDQPAGAGGFGYDPVFYVAEHGRTMAELSSDEKNAISHRGRALRRLLELLQSGD